MKVNDGWGSRGKPQYSLRETLLNIEANNSLVMFKHLEQDPVFAPFLSEIQHRILDLAGPRMRDDVTIGRGTILVASPWRITSYHIDADVNFLFQIAGDKEFRVFDQAERDSLSHRELETTSWATSTARSTLRGRKPGPRSTTCSPAAASTFR